MLGIRNVVSKTISLSRLTGYVCFYFLKATPERKSCCLYIKRTSPAAEIITSSRRRVVWTMVRNRGIYSDYDLLTCDYNHFPQEEKKISPGQF